MIVRLFTAVFYPQLGGFPGEPLAHIDGEIESVAEHFFQHQGYPYVLFIVHYRAAKQPLTAPTRPAPTGARSLPPAPAARVRAELSADECELFDRLRLWRNSRAQAEGVPPYVLLHNRQLAQLARLRPQTLTALREIDGIGEAKAGRFGGDLLKMLAYVPQTSPPVSALPPDHAGTAHAA